MVHETKIQEITRRQLIELLNEDLSREVQTVTGYANIYRFFSDASDHTLAASLKAHAEAELAHAIIIAAQIDTLGGAPVITPLPVNTSNKAAEMLKHELDSEAAAITNYLARIVQCEMLGEYAVAEIIRQILAQERDHYSRLVSVLSSR